MQYPTVKVNGVLVRVDEEGRYNLNDLHAAAVMKGEATGAQRPTLLSVARRSRDSLKH